MNAELDTPEFRDADRTLTLLLELVSMLKQCLRLDSVIDNSVPSILHRLCNAKNTLSAASIKVWSKEVKDQCAFVYTMDARIRSTLESLAGVGGAPPTSLDSSLSSNSCNSSVVEKTQDVLQNNHKVLERADAAAPATTTRTLVETPPGAVAAAPAAAAAPTSTDAESKTDRGVFNDERISKLDWPAIFNCINTRALDAYSILFWTQTTRLGFDLYCFRCKYVHRGLCVNATAVLSQQQRDWERRRKPVRQPFNDSMFKQETIKRMMTNFAKHLSFCHWKTSLQAGHALQCYVCKCEHYGRCPGFTCRTFTDMKAYERYAIECKQSKKTVLRFGAWKHGPCNITASSSSSHGTEDKPHTDQLIAMSTTQSLPPSQEEQGSGDDELEEGEIEPHETRDAGFTHSPYGTYVDACCAANILALKYRTWKRVELAKNQWTNHKQDCSSPSPSAATSDWSRSQSRKRQCI